MRAALDAENRTGDANAFGKEMQDAARPASEIDHALPWLDPERVELSFGIRSEVGDLALQSLLFQLITSQEVVICRRR